MKNQKKINNRLNKELKKRLDKNVMGCFSKIYLKEEQLTELICENLYKNSDCVIKKQLIAPAVF